MRQDLILPCALFPVTLYTLILYPFGVRGEAPPKFFFMAVKENVITRTDDFIKWFLPKLEKFPRNYKFLFGDRMGAAAAGGRSARPACGRG